MKFNFKKQQYQTDAVNSVINIFKGQAYKDSFSYIRDIGKDNKVKVKDIQVKIKDEEVNDSNQEDEAFDPYDDTGYKNDDIELSNEQTSKKYSSRASIK